MHLDRIAAGPKANRGDLDGLCSDLHLVQVESAIVSGQDFAVGAKDVDVGAPRTGRCEDPSRRTTPEIDAVAVLLAAMRNDSTSTPPGGIWTSTAPVDERSPICACIRRVVETGRPQTANEPSLAVFAATV